MANASLTGKKFAVPPKLQYITGDAMISYSMLKKLKNFFDYNDSSNPEFQKKGGEEMKKFIESSLNSQRNRVKQSSEIKSEFTPNNGYKKTHTKDRQTKNVTSPGGIPKVYKSSTHKRLYKGEMLYEEINRMIELINHKSIL